MANPYQTIGLSEKTLPRAYKWFFWAIVLGGLMILCSQLALSQTQGKFGDYVLRFGGDPCINGSTVIYNNTPITACGWVDMTGGNKGRYQQTRLKDGYYKFSNNSLSVWATAGGYTRYYWDINDLTALTISNVTFDFYMAANGANCYYGQFGAVRPDSEEKWSVQTDASCNYVFRVGGAAKGTIGAAGTKFSRITIEWKPSTYTRLYFNNASIFNLSGVDSAAETNYLGFYFNDANIQQLYVNYGRVWNGTKDKDPALRQSQIIYPKVSFISSQPDITSANLFKTNFSAYFNISNANNNTIWLYHKTNTTKSNFVFTQNGTTIHRGFVKSDTSRIIVKSNKWNLSIDEHEIYPATYNLDEDYFRVTAHSPQTLTTSNALMKIRFFNVSNIYNHNFFEIMANTTSLTTPLRAYYCNSSYTTGDILTSAFCTNFYNLPATKEYNHTHTKFSKHQVLPFPVKDKKVNGVGVTNLSYLILRGTSGSTWSLYSAPKLTRTNTIQTSANLGTSYSSQTYTIDAHLHAFANATVYYYACANNTGQNCTSKITDFIDLTDLPPSSPNVYYPKNQTYNGVLSVNWTASTGFNGHTITKYNLTILNSTFGKPKGIKDSLTNLSYRFNTQSFEDGFYIAQVEVCDNHNLCSFGFSEKFQIDNTAPTMAIYAPENNLLYANNSDRFNFICSDPNFWGFDVFIFNKTGYLYANRTRNITGTFYHWNRTEDLTTLGDGLYNFSASCFDSHTGNILKSTAQKNATAIKIGSFIITSSDIPTQISYKTLTDRISFSFSYPVSKEHYLVVSSKEKIFKVEGSKYYSHLVSGSNWYDSNPYLPARLTRLNDYSYLTGFVGSSFNFESVGDLNNRTTLYHFKVDRVAPSVVVNHPQNRTVYNRSRVNSFNVTFITEDYPRNVTNCSVTLNNSPTYRGIPNLVNKTLLAIPLSGLNGLVQYRVACTDKVLNGSVYTVRTFLSKYRNINVTNSTFVQYLNWTVFAPLNNSLWINRTKLSFVFNYTNNDMSTAKCNLSRNNTVIAGGSFTNGLNNLTDSAIPATKQGYFTYKINCTVEAQTEQTSNKLIKFNNSVFIPPAPNTTQQILNEIMGLSTILLLVAMFALHFGLMWAGFHFRFQSLLFLSGILGVVASLVALSYVGAVHVIAAELFFVIYALVAVGFCSVQVYERFKS